MRSLMACGGCDASVDVGMMLHSPSNIDWVGDQNNCDVGEYCSRDCDALLFFFGVTKYSHMKLGGN